MPNKLAIFIACVFTTSPAMAADAERFHQIFEAICVGSQFKLEIMKQSVEVMAKQMDLKLLDAPKPMLKMINPDNLDGWGIASNGETYLVSYGEKHLDGKVSRNCVVTVKETNVSEAIKMIETRYNVKKMLDERQGSSRVIGYGAALFGFPEPTFLSLQITPAESTNSGSISASLFTDLE